MLGQWVDLPTGVRIGYDEAGAGDPALVLVHGMACDRTHLRHQFDHLRDRYRVVAVDLRGHGVSDKPDGVYDSATFVGDFLALFDALDLDRPVMIGHSLGGSLSLALAVAHPESISGLVMLDSGIRPPAHKTAELQPFYATLGGPDHGDRVRDFVVGRLFEPVDGPEVTAEVAATMAATPAHVFRAMGDGVLAFDSHQAATTCAVPSLLVTAARPFAVPESLAALGDNWQVARVVGSGHFLQLVVPDQVNAMLDRFLALQFPPGPGETRTGW